MAMTRSLEDLRAEARRNTQDAVLRGRLLASLRRLDAALLQWRDWDADQRLPTDERRGAAKPSVDRETLFELRQAVLRHLRAFAAAGW
jgi:hypothetical protein